MLLSPASAPPRPHPTLWPRPCRPGPARFPARLCTSALPTSTKLPPRPQLYCPRPRPSRSCLSAATRATLADPCTTELPCGPRPHPKGRLPVVSLLHTSVPPGAFQCSYCSTVSPGRRPPPCPAHRHSPSFSLPSPLDCARLTPATLLNPVGGKAPPSAPPNPRPPSGPAHAGDHAHPSPPQALERWPAARRGAVLGLAAESTAPSVCVSSRISPSTKRRYCCLLVVVVWRLTQRG